MRKCGHYQLCLLWFSWAYIFLYINFKSEDNAYTYKLQMEKYFKTLIEWNYFTYYDTFNNRMVWRPIAIILTGAYPKNLKTLARGIKGYFGDNKRYVTLDSQLHKLEKLQESANLSVVASSSSFNQLLQKCGSSRLQVVIRGNILAEEFIVYLKYGRFTFEEFANPYIGLSRMATILC